MRLHISRVASFFLVLTLCLSSASAHAGRTDSSGGHYDRSSGVYHYHHGYPAHQHTDGVCPYNFDDQTDHSNSSSSSTAKTDTSQTTSEVAEPEADDRISIWDVIAFLFLLLLFGPILLLPAIPIVLLFSKIFSAPLGKRRERKRRRELEEKRHNFISKYGGLPLNEIAPPPTDRDYIGTDMLPHRRGFLGKDDYIVYVTRTGSVYHACMRCGTAYGSPKNIAECDLRPCSRCVSSYPPDTAWYRKQKALLDESNTLFGHSIFEGLSVIYPFPPP